MKNLAKAVCFCLILTVLLAVTNYILMPNTDFSADTRGGVCDEPDYLFLGTSNVFYNVNPLVIWNETGYIGYNVSSEQAPLIVSYYELKNEFQKRIPKIVFLDCGGFEYNYGKPSFNQLSLDKMPFNWNKLELIARLGEDDEKNEIRKHGQYNKISYLIPLYKFHDRWKEIFTGTLYSRYHSKYEHTFMGYVAEKSVYVYEKDYKWLPTLAEFGGTYLTEISDLNRKYLSRIRKLCYDRGVELILFKTPSKGWIKEMHDAVSAFAKEESLPFFDMNEEAALKEMGINEQKDFADSSSHFNVFGAEKVSRYLADYMKEHCGFDDRRGQNDPLETAWNQMYRDYLEYKEQS